MASDAPTARPNGGDAGAERSLGVLSYGTPDPAPPPGGASGPTHDGAEPTPEEAGTAAPSGEGRVETGEPGTPAGEDAGAAAAGGEEISTGEPGEAAAEAGAEPGAEGQPASWSSLDELFTAAGLEFDAAQSLPVRVKVNGRESQVPLGELISNHQIHSAADERLAEAKQKAQALDQELAQQREASEANLAQTAKLLEHAESQLDQETKNIDWAALRKDDPDEYAAKKVEISERRAELDKLKNEAVESYRQEQEQEKQKRQKQLKERQAAEQKALFEAVPEWSDPETFKAESKRLTQYLKGQGFTDQDIATAADHRLIVMARKAMLQDESRKGAAAKKVAKPQRTLRPGARPAASKPKPKSMEELWYGRR